MIKWSIKALVVFVSMSLLLSSCNLQARFTKKNLDLKVASRESLLGVVAWFRADAIILDKDDYGRTLYGFRGQVVWHDNQVIALGIIQESDNKTVSFYDGKNINVKEYLGRYDAELNRSMLDDYFNAEIVEKLKQENDWNQPLQHELYFTTKITNETPQPLSKSELNDIITQLDYPFFWREMILLSVDKNGKMLILANDCDGDFIGTAYLVMITKDKKIIPDTGILHLETSQYLNYFDILNQFKQANDWAFN